MMLSRKLIALLIVLAAATQARAAADLQITEIWVGGLEGTEATSDWFELTNFGDMAATGLDGTIFYDDNSADPTVNDPMEGIDTIAAGESVIYLVSWEDDWATAADAIASFEDMFGPPAGSLSGVQIGYVSGGGGLGGGSDAVFVFDGNTAGANIIDSQEYEGDSADNYASFVSDANGDFGPFGMRYRAQDGVWGAYTGNLPAADGMDPTTGAPIPNAIGSPGAVVPEPSCLSLLLIAVLGICGRRR